MIRRWVRGPLGLTCRRCLALAALPTLLTALASALLHRWLRPELGGEAAPATASPWLALPMVVAAMTCAVAAVVFWPTFANGRPGRQWIDRAQRGRLGGVGAAIAGALLAQLVLTLPLTTWLADRLDAPRHARCHYELTAPQPILDEQRPRLTFAVPTTEPIGEVWLRPLAGLPTGSWHGTTVEILADGEPLPALPAPIANNRQLARVQFPGRTIRELTIVRTGGSVPLAFVDDTAGLVGDATRSNRWNGAWLAVLALLPSAVAMALAACCGLAAGLPTVIGVVVSTVFLLTGGGLGIFDHGVLALLRGQWLAPSRVFPRCAASLAVGFFAMILTMLLRPRVRR